MSERTVLMVEVMGHWVLGWTLVVLAVAVWIRAARPGRAAVRYGGWLLATFAGAVLAPAVLLIGPLASWREVLRGFSSGPAAVAPAESRASFRSWFDGVPTSLRTESVAVRAGDAAVPDGARRRIDPPRTMTAPTVGMVRRTASDRWLLRVCAVWAAGFLFFAGRLGWSALRVRCLLAEAEAIGPAGLDSELEASCRELRIRRPVRVAFHPEIAAPMCVGLLRPIILWPTPENCPMGPRQRLASLTHELAHLHHGDDVIALLAEVWRALTWFFPPVHLTLSRLRREREYRCDDLAAAKLDTPEHYAQWLLDLAPVRVGPPAPMLAASLLGGTSLADRVRRIIAGEPRQDRPLGHRARALLILGAMAILGVGGSVRLVGFAGRAAAGEPVDAPLPDATPAQLAAKIRDAMGRYDDRGSFRIVFTDTRDMNFRFTMNRGTPEEQKPILVSFRGRARHESDGTRWRTEYDSVMPSSGSSRLWPDRWSTGFDGTRRYDWQVSKNQFIVGECSAQARQWTPRSVIWKQDDGLVEMLEEAGPGKSAIAVTQRTIDGMRCYVVESKTRDGQYGGETVVSPRQGYLATGRVWKYRGRPYFTRRLQGLHEVAPGLWAPDRIEEELIMIRDDGASRLNSRRRIQVVEYRPGRIPPADALRVVIPYGVDLIDRPSGQAFHNDPWWPEIGAMIREKYAWPPPDFSPLRNLGSASERKRDGEPAPPFRIASWLNTKPADLASFRGKVVLVEFGSIGDYYAPLYAPALRELYAAYHPAGLEILSIHPPGSDAEEIRRFARDYRLPYPVVIDEGRPGTSGVTAEAFAIRGRICAFLIDHEGKICPAGETTIGGGRVVETVVTLLKASGARDVKAVSLGIPQLPNEAFRAADRLLQAKAKEALDALPSGKIVGRVVDGNHRPIAGADVRADLHFTMMTSTSPGAYYAAHTRATDDRFNARTEADGRFEISGLCKGEYELMAVAHGRARAGRKVFIGPELRAESVEFVLDQGDSIAGEVRDPQGRPIANASVKTTQRQHFVDGQLEFVVGYPERAATTGEAGRFRLTGLQEGRYIIGVQADGFQYRELEGIPAGDEKVVVTLERSP